MIVNDRKGKKKWLTKARGEARGWGVIGADRVPCIKAKA